MFSTRRGQKDDEFYYILEVGYNSHISEKGVKDVDVELQKKWDFDLGDGTTLEPIHNVPLSKVGIFMINHTDTGTQEYNVEVEVDYREFETRIVTTVFVMYEGACNQRHLDAQRIMC